MSETKQCLVCGKTSNSNSDEYYLFDTLSQHYRWFGDVVDICKSCGDKANSLTSTSGVGRRKFLSSGVLPQRQLQMQMNGGYFSE